MFEVVGCSECDALWIREGEARTTQCKRCGTKHRVDQLRALATCETADAARDARSELLAARSVKTDGDVAAYSSLSDDVTATGISDADYLSAHGLDPESVNEFDNDGQRNRDRRTRVLDAIDRAEVPTAERVVELSERDGVPRDAAERYLEVLLETGTVIRERGEYRVV